MLIYAILALSVLLNVLLCWYVVKLLKKFFYISENMSDTYLTCKAFGVFVESMYGMDNYHGEPMVQELLLRIRDVINEMETFREIFEYTIDAELERELDGPDEEEKTQ
tara:strand:- start:696 stop:1019 length:324 start_codon:yes stop_codon:yes gene_type:complete